AFACVRFRAEEVVVTDRHAKDARVRRTRRQLREAIVSLIHEKSYPAIVVNEILERADVGRSAFHAHFPNKDALLASGIEYMLHATPPRRLPPSVGRFSGVLGFSFPVFEYVGQCRHGWVESRSLLSAREVDDVFLGLAVPPLTSLPGRSGAR